MAPRTAHWLVLACTSLTILGCPSDDGSDGEAYVYEDALDSLDPLVEPRFQHTATALPDGRVLVVGGTLATPSSMQLDSYVAEVAVWEGDAFVRGASLAEPRAGHTATALSDGRVVIVGGTTHVGAPSPAFGVEVWEPSSESLSAPGSLDFNLVGHCAVATPEDRVLIIDDCESSGCTVASIDPDTGSYESLGGAPSHRYALDLDCAALPDGRVVLGGALDEATDEAAPALDIYDPSSQSFTSVDLPAAFGREATVAALSSGDVLVIGDAAGVEPGGAGTLGVVYTASGEVRALTGEAGAINRAEHLVTPLSDGRALVSGGLVALSPDLDDAPGMDLVDPAAGTVTPVPGSEASFGTRDGHAGALYADGPALLIGGRVGMERVATVHVFR